MKKADITKLWLYHSGELSEEEKQAFEAALEQQPEWRRMLADMKEQGARLSEWPAAEPGRDLVAAALQKIEQDPRYPVFLGWRLVTPACAAVLVLLLVGWVLFPAIRRPSAPMAGKRTRMIGGAAETELAFRVVSTRARVNAICSHVQAFSR